MFAQIPCRRTPWSLNNNAAGRGACRGLLRRNLTTSRSILREQEEAESYFVDPTPVRRKSYTPWNSRRALPSHLLHAKGPLFIPEQSPGDEPTSSETNPAADEANIDEPFSRQIQPEEEARPTEQREQERIQSRVALWDSEEQSSRESLVGRRYFRESDQIYVMGLDPTGRYIAHALAGSKTIPPVRYIFHNRGLCRQWDLAKRQLTLYRGYDALVRNRIIAEDTSAEAEVSNEGLIENLIVTLPAGQVVQAVQSIRHRLDHRSSICLVNDGLGVAEALIEAHFPDPLTRPMFLLGHLSTALGHTNNMFSVQEVEQGRLYMTLFSKQAREPGMFQIKHHPPLERTTRGTHFIRLMTAMPGLNATGHPMEEFLRFKLPTLAFRSIVDPLAALLNCTYEKLPKNMYARQLMDELIGEVSRVVARFPECRDSRRLRELAVASSLRKEVIRKLMLQRTADSKMRSQLTRGWDTDIEFLTGYFVRRGRELQVSVSTLDSLLWAVKAKRMVWLKKNEAEIPFDYGGN